MSPDAPARTDRARNRRLGRGIHAVVLIVGVVGIVVTLNYLASRYYRRFDVTSARLHTLSPQSLQILDALDAEIEVIGFYPNGQGQEAYEKWLDEYVAHTALLRYRTVDPIRRPAEAEQLGWDIYGSGLIVRRGGRAHQVRTPDEQDITSAILKVARGAAQVVYFLGGHNEPSPTGYEGRGYGDVAALLESNNYQVRSLNLSVTDAVPSDAAVLVVGGLETPLLADEQARIARYLRAGGKALFMIDPGLETGVNPILAPWNVRIENKVVIDMWKSLSGDPATPVLDSYAFSQITKDMGNLLIAMPVASPIALPADAPEDGSVVFTSLATTSERSWAETNYRDSDAQYDPAVDLRGPLTLIATLESVPANPSDPGDAPQMRVVLIGDSDFVTNDVLRQIPNGQYLFLNAVNWLAEEESLIAIGPKTRAPANIRLTRAQEGAVCFGTLILIPAIILLAGLIVWLKRR